MARGRWGADPDSGSDFPTQASAVCPSTVEGSPTYILNYFIALVKINVPKILEYAREDFDELAFNQKRDRYKAYENVRNSINELRRRGIFAWQFSSEEGYPRVGVLEEIDPDLAKKAMLVKVSEIPLTGSSYIVQRMAEEFIRWRIERNLSSPKCGFKRIKGQLMRPTGKSVNIRLFGKKGKIERLRAELHEVVDIGVQPIEIKDNEVMCIVKLDLKHSLILRLRDAVLRLRKKGLSDKDIVGYISEVSVEPKGAMASLIEITNELVDEKTMEPWKKRYWIKIPPDDFKVRVSFGERGKHYDYPCSTCYVVVRPENVRQKLWLNPVFRFSRICEIAKEALCEYDYKGLIRVLYESTKPISISEFCSRVKYADFGRVFQKGKRIQKPKLRFFENKVSSNIINGLKRYGPYDGATDIDKLFVIVFSYDERTQTVCGEFIRRLCEQYKTLKLGEINREAVELIVADDEENAVKKILTISDALVILIPPDNERETKRIFLRNLFESGQKVIVQTILGDKVFEAVSKDKTGKAILDALALSLYIKANSRSLDGERGVTLEKVPFILDKPADGADETCYGFIDVSRRFGMRRAEATVALSIIDARGREPKMIELRRMGEKIRYGEFARILDKIRKEVEHRQVNIKRIVLFVDGKIVPEDTLIDFCNKFYDIHEKLRAFLQDKEVCVVNVIKRTQDRIFRRLPDGRIYNPPLWLFIRTGLKDILLIASEFKGARTGKTIPTAMPVRLTINIIKNGTLINPDQTQINRILKEYCALSMLDWVSPRIEPKVPAYLKFVQKAGEILTSSEFAQLWWFPV